jgi:hypothetical protein
MSLSKNNKENTTFSIMALSIIWSIVMSSVAYKLLSVIRLNVVMLSAVSQIKMVSFTLMTNKLECLPLPSIFS